jgi:hypothetical protein
MLSDQKNLAAEVHCSGEPAGSTCAGSCHEAGGGSSTALGKVHAQAFVVTENDGTRNASFAMPFYTKNYHFAKTGSGQTQGKLKKKMRFSQAARSRSCSWLTRGTRRPRRLASRRRFNAWRASTVARRGKRRPGSRLDRATAH